MLASIENVLLHPETSLDAENLKVLGAKSKKYRVKNNNSDRTSIRAT